VQDINRIPKLDVLITTLLQKMTEPQPQSTCTENLVMFNYIREANGVNWRDIM